MHRLKQRLIELPPGIGIVEFLQHDGKPPIRPAGAGEGSQAFTLADFQACSLATHRESLEERTTEGIELHSEHLTAAFGERFPVRELNLVDPQGDVDRRAEAKGTGG